MVEYFRRRAVVAAVVAGVVAAIGVFVLYDDARYVFDGLMSRALPLVILSALCGIGSLVLLLRDAHRGARVLAMGAVATVVVGLGRRAVAVPAARDARSVDAAAARTRRCGRSSSCSSIAAVVILPSLGLLYVLDQKNLVDAEPEPIEA